MKILPQLNLNNFNFGCTSIDKCKTNGEQPENPEIPSSVSTSLDDKDNNNNSNKNNKSKIGLTIGIAVAAVVVVVIIVVVVVVVVLRKKSYGKYVNDIKTDDIADNLNGDSSASQFKDQESAL